MITYAKLSIFIDGVNKLNNELEPITYYKLKTSGLDISNNTIKECLSFCEKLGFLEARKINRKNMYIIRYKKLVGWYMLEKYVREIRDERQLK